MSGRLSEMASDRIQSVEAVRGMKNSPPVAADLFLRPTGDESLLTLLSEVKKKRHHLIWARAKIAVQENDIAAQLPLNLAAYEEVLALLRESIPHISGSNICVEKGAILMGKWKDLENLAGILISWQKRLANATDDLRDLEARLWSKENELYTILSNLDPGSLPERASKMSSTAPADSNFVQSSMSDEDPDEETYYEAIGEINLLRDRLFNLESSLTRARLRNEGIGKGRAPELHIGFTLEDRSLEDHMRDRKQIIVDYFRNKKVLEEAARRCLEKRIDVEPPNLPPSLDQIFTVAQNEFLDPGDDPTPQDDASQSHVERWLYGVARSQPSAAGDLAAMQTTLCALALEDNDGLKAGQISQHIQPSKFETPIGPDRDTFSEPDMRRLQQARV